MSPKRRAAAKHLIRLAALTLLPFPLLLHARATAQSPGATKQSPQQAPPAGVVVDIVGGWERVVSRQQLSLGDFVDANERVRPRNPGEGRLVIARLPSSEERWECSTSTPCSNEYRITPPVQPPSGFWAFVRSYAPSGRQFPKVFTAVRGGENPLRHAIVEAGRNVDLTPAVEGVAKGRYTIEISGAPGSARGAAPVSIDVDLAKDAAHIDRLRPGLYVLNVLTMEGRNAGSPVAILAVEDAQAARAAFAEATAAIRNWPTADGTLRDAMIVRVLYGLAAQYPAR